MDCWFRNLRWFLRRRVGRVFVYSIKKKTELLLPTMAKLHFHEYVVCEREMNPQQKIDSTNHCLNLE